MMAGTCRETYNDGLSSVFAMVFGSCGEKNGEDLGRKRSTS